MLQCADGLPSKDVAAELGLHEHTVGTPPIFEGVPQMACLMRLAPAAFP